MGSSVLVVDNTQLLSFVVLSTVSASLVTAHLGIATNCRVLSQTLKGQKMNKLKLLERAKRAVMREVFAAIDAYVGRARSARFLYVVKPKHNPVSDERDAVYQSPNSAGALLRTKFCPHFVLYTRRCKRCNRSS